MIRGTTPTLTFTLPFSTDEIDETYVTFAQHRMTKVEKTLDDCTLNGNKLSVKLTQKDTLAFESDTKVEIQLGIKSGQSVMRSKIITVDAERILKNGEI